MGDITWYSDLINPTTSLGCSGDEYSACNESADALFSCETFELVNVTEDGATLLFGAFAGHSIEFKVNITKIAPMTKY